MITATFAEISAAAATISNSSKAIDDLNDQLKAQVDKTLAAWEGASGEGYQAAQKKWADEMGYEFPVLSDFWPHGAVAQAYGVFNYALGCANRATFMIDKDGTVVDVIESPDLGTPREVARYEEALTKLAG